MRRFYIKKVLFFAAVLFLLAFLPACVKSGQAPSAALDAYHGKDYATALKEFQGAADDGNAEAQYYLAGMYREGKGVAKDKAKSQEFMLSSAKQGYAPAQVGLGLMLCAKSDYSNAAGWFQKAADHKHKTGLFLTGLMYARGTGVNKDISEALRYFKLAKEEGFKVPENLLTEKGISRIKPLSKKR